MLIVAVLFLFLSGSESILQPQQQLLQFSLSSTGQSQTPVKRASDEQLLLRYILRTYDRSVRPVFNASESVAIQLGLTLAHIFSIDEKKQVLSMNVWLEQEWIDKRIFWNVNDFGGLAHLTVPTRFLWTPDIVLYNNAEDFSHEVMQTNLGVYHDGKIAWMPPMKTRSICKLDVTYFPFDNQICFLRFGSWIYDRGQVDVFPKNLSYPITLDTYTSNGEWEIVRTAVEKKARLYPLTQLPFTDLTFTIHLKRRTLFYTYNIIVPCVMLSVLTLMQYWLPSESGEKVTLGLTVLLAYSVFSFNIGENMPETSDVIPLIAIYIMCIMGISSLSVILSVTVLNIRHAGERKRKVPEWLRILAFNWLGPFVGRLTTDELANPRWIRRQNSFESSFYRLTRHLRSQRCPIGEVKSPKQLISARNPSKLVEPIPTAIGDVMNRAAHLIDRFEALKVSEENIHEWRKIARIFDKFFFWLVFVLTIVVAVSMLLLAPQFSRNRIDEIFSQLLQNQSRQPDLI